MRRLSRRQVRQAREARLKRRTQGARYKRVGGESASSAAYRNGKTVGYKYRIKGPNVPP